MKDYYKILGVARQAGAEEIKAAYRKLAKQYHPDVVKGDREKEEYMYEIQEAYACLGEEGKRKKYDEALLHGRKRSGQEGKGQKGPEKGERQARGGHGMAPDMGQFERFFGFQPGKGMETYRHNRNNAEKPKGPVKPEEMFEFFLGGRGQNGGRQ